MSDKTIPPKQLDDLTLPEFAAMIGITLAPLDIGDEPKEKPKPDEVQT